jgi:hypothetical protein
MYHTCLFCQAGLARNEAFEQGLVLVLPEPARAEFEKLAGQSDRSDDGRSSQKPTSASE